jgi:hypothetical protein
MADANLMISVSQGDSSSFPFYFTRGLGSSLLLKMEGKKCQLIGSFIPQCIVANLELSRII